MARTAYLSQLQPKCTNCKLRYDLTRAQALSEKKRKRTIHCPHCSYQVGRT